MGGQILYTPPSHASGNTLLGGVQKRGAHEIPAAGVRNIHHPPLSLKKCLLAKKTWGIGGGGIYFLPGGDFCFSVITIDTEIEAKRNNMISELITFRITKAKAKVKFGVKYLCGHACERSSVQLISIQKRERINIFGELISLQFPCQLYCRNFTAGNSWKINSCTVMIGAVVTHPEAKNGSATVTVILAVLHRQDLL